MADLDLLKAGLEAMDIPYTDHQIGALGRYIDELLLWNPTHGLISAEGGSRDAPEELIPRHILDSLAPWRVFHKFQPATLADIGSGAGLPGIPLAIFLPRTEVVLVEKQKRRCNFLRNALAVAGLGERVRVEQRNMEDLPGSFDLVTMRAFAALPDVYDDLLGLVAPGGRIAALKGTKVRVREEIAALKARPDGPARIDLISLEVAFLEAERNLVVMEP